MKIAVKIGIDEGSGTISKYRSADTKVAEIPAPRLIVNTIFPVMNRTTELYKPTAKNPKSVLAIVKSNVARNAGSVTKCVVSNLTTIAAIIDSEIAIESAATAILFLMARGSSLAKFKMWFLSVN